ncbi:hypothetical protein ACFYYB_26570 [Streptomyces sp. NPDC002886]|uniref:hypothetical protein n=1 Tax=Streptomyces sp. NPDC002886 TaxID=3364667 RepID=UPI003675AF1E
MTKESESDRVEPTDVHAAREAIDAYLSRADSSREHGVGEDAQRADGPVSDRIAELVAREAWDAVLVASPPPPDPAVDPGPAVEPLKVAERRAQAVAIVRGLQALGYRLDETLLPGPDMAAG